MEACCSHDHDCADQECGGTSLYGYIDHPKVRVLNSSNPEAVEAILGPWDRRQARDHTPLESDDDDPELLLYIPFTSDVKIRSIMVVGGDDGTSPNQMRAFTNRDNLDFESVADLAPLQEWALLENPRGLLEYQTRFTKFQGVASLSLHFPSSFGGDLTRIWFIGLRGEGTNNQRKAVANAVYESRAQPKDHRLPAEDGAASMLM
mmetsp:Transcript_41219/g.78733  ORF Transcript_41219/g.78733 Transcript_41219/m.78733 type:complete len:205 (-) Transcript_41219:304-918(-)